MKPFPPKKNVIEVICLVSGIVLSMVGLYFYHMQYLCYEYTPLLFILGAVVCIGNALLTGLYSFKKNPAKKHITKNVIVDVIASAVSLIGLIFILNAIIGNGELELISMTISVYITFIETAVLSFLCISKIFTKKLIKTILSILVLAGFVIGSYSYITTQLAFALFGDYKAPSPVLSGYEKAESVNNNINGDIYVSTTGNDLNGGTKDAPLKTIEKAVELVRSIDKSNKNGITVCIEAGEYRVSTLEFTKEDSGTEKCPIKYCSYNGKVIITGGKKLDESLFSPVNDKNVLAKLSDDAKENVVCTDLTKLGLSIKDWGKLYPVGKYGTQANYDGDTQGPIPCSLYFNGESLTTARYPNEGFLNTVDIIREGQGEESSTSNHAKMEGWADLRNPETTIFTVDSATADRINSYSSLEDVWLWTALIYEWADTTVPIKSFDYEKKTLEPAYVSKFGAVPDSTYYIFNCIEELDCAGEWYLNRNNGMLYIYPPEKMDNAEITLSLSTQDLVTITDAEYLSFEGLYFGGTRSNGIVVNSNNVTIENCVINQLSGIGVCIDGYRNNVLDCEFTHIGGAAVDIKGGDRKTLKPGENRVENCLIHDYSEVSITGGPGVNLFGVGNICAHNEFYNAPQQAVIYGGNNNVIEYNNIHDVALLSADCGAIYTGRRWDEAGAIIRYNAIYNLGGNDFSPYGIYFDDGSLGQTAYGNIIINCRSSAFMIGGGRDHNIYNNILVNCDQAFFYDDRSRCAALEADYWFEHAREGWDMHKNLLDSPWQSEIWKNTYPYMAEWSLDYSNTDDSRFIGNPADSKINKNLIVQYTGNFGFIEDSVYKYSDISNNPVYKFFDTDELFVDGENGDYSLRDDSPVFKKIPDFQSLPFDEIGIK